MNVKACSKCGEFKEFDLFKKNKNRKSGIDSYCKECHNKATKLFKINNQEKEKARGDKYRLENKEKESLRLKIYRENNREKEKLRAQKYRLENPEKCKIAQKNWAKLNPDKKRKHSLDSYYRHHEDKKLQARQYKKNHAEEIKIYAKQWRINNKEMIKKYYKDNKDWFKTWNSNRRARLIQACVPWANLEKIKTIYAEAMRLTKETGIEHHVDHKHPLNGKKICGLHHEDNLQILTKQENLSKGNKFTPG